MEDESCVSRIIIDELHSSQIQGDQMEGERQRKVVFLEVALMNFILRISKEIKWKVKVLVLEVSLMSFIFRISKEIKWKVKVLLLEVSVMNFILRISKEI